jgi:hypothetical protein
MGLLDRLSARRADADSSTDAASANEPVFATKALRKFLTTLTQRESPLLVDLGPVVGSNVSFFGEQLGCKIFVEDIFADLERHIKAGKLEDLPAFLTKRLPHKDATVDGVLCWDIFDFLDKASGQALAESLTKVLRPDGALLAFFGTAQSPDSRYTKYIVVDDVNLKHRPYPASRGRQTVLLNRDIIRLFPHLRVSDSFLLQNNLREVLFRKPAA